jgi:uncharacterized RDD family membrane protein YckC
MMQPEPHVPGENAVPPVEEAPRFYTEVVGRRGVQFVLDIALTFLLWLASAALWTAGYWPGSDTAGPLLLFWRYLAVFVLCPAAFRGRTPGMTVMSISIVRRDGGRPSFAQLLVRTLFLVIEGPLLVGLLGLILILLSRDNTRLGDKATHTLVVWSPGGRPALKAASSA